SLDGAREGPPANWDLGDGIQRQSNRVAWPPLSRNAGRNPDRDFFAINKLIPQRTGRIVQRFDQGTKWRQPPLLPARLRQPLMPEEFRPAIVSRTGKSPPLLRTQAQRESLQE